VVIGWIVIAGWQLSGICCGSQKYTFLISDRADPGVAMATSRSVLRAVITFSISKKEKKEGIRIFVCGYYTSFALFHKQKIIP